MSLLLDSHTRKTFLLQEMRHKSGNTILFYEILEGKKYTYIYKINEKESTSFKNPVVCRIKAYNEAWSLVA